MFKRQREELAACRAAIRALEELVAASKTDWEGLARELPGLRADMDLQWEKVNRALGRLAKRDAIEAQATGAVDPNGPTSEDEITQQILEGYNPWPTRS